MKLRLLALAIALLAVMTQGTAIAQSRASQPQSTTIDTQTVKQNMQEVQNYLKECGAFYIATVDGDQPRVRPFGV